MDKFIVTIEWLQQHCIKAGWGYIITMDQAKQLGETNHLEPGWLKRAIGKIITIEQKERFEKRLSSKQVRKLEKNKGSSNG
jgi:hypothetical protein